MKTDVNILMRKAPDGCYEMAGVEFTHTGSPEEFFHGGTFTEGYTVGFDPAVKGKHGDTIIIMDDIDEVPTEEQRRQYMQYFQGTRADQMQTFVDKILDGKVKIRSANPEFVREFLNSRRRKR
jgi:hypothetical protein